MSAAPDRPRQARSAARQGEGSAVSLVRQLGQWIGGAKGSTGQAASDVLPVRLGGMDFLRSTGTPVPMRGFDQTLVWVAVTLLALGLVMVYSASISMPDNPKFSR